MGKNGITLLETAVGALLLALVAMGITRGISGALKSESSLREKGKIELGLALAFEHIARTGRLAKHCEIEGEALVCDGARFNPAIGDGHAGGLLHLDFDRWEAFPPPQTPREPTGSHWATKLTYENISALELCGDARVLCRDRMSEIHDEFLFAHYGHGSGDRRGRFFRFRLSATAVGKTIQLQSAFFVRYPTPFPGMTYLAEGME